MRDNPYLRVSVAEWPPISVAEVFQKRVRKYRKNAALVMFDGARGPLWLRRAVMWVARRLKMLGHDREGYDWYGEIQINNIDKYSLTQTLNEGLVHLINNYGVDPRRLEIVCGMKEVDGIRVAMSNELAFVAPIDIRDGRSGMEWRGINVRVVPWLNGIAIIPKAGQ
jgi:hypothetical protein